MRIIVLGGYGNFGARICRALARDGFEVIACGRDPDLGHNNAGFDKRIGKARVDILDHDLEIRLRALSPAVVVHCVGPFQGQDYRVAKASIAAGANYIDLADGRRFVADFKTAIDSIAQSAGRLAVTGASTLPALSSAVIDVVAGRMNSVDEIQISIAPAQRSPRGVATLRAVFGYLGRPFDWLEQGVWKPAYGWQELRRFRFAGLGRRWAAACDVPDLELFPKRYPGVGTIQFRAALEFGIEHFVLAAAAGLRGFGMPLPIERWAVPFERLARCLDCFGGAHGGMLVSLRGHRRDGRRVRVEWHLTADSEHGPEIPCMAAILLVKKLKHSQITVHGATPCVGLLSLDEFAPEFARWNIHTRVEEHIRD
jgi:hypothetical protein